jgi:hypothetical protein
MQQNNQTHFSEIIAVSLAGSSGMCAAKSLSAGNAGTANRGEVIRAMPMALTRNLYLRKAP